MAPRHARQAYRGGEKRHWPAWVWLGIGVLLGLMLSALVLIKDWAPILRKRNLPQPNPEAVAPKEPEQAVADKPAPPKKTFDFYSVLPEMEVVIPDAELSAKARAEQQRRQMSAAQAQNGGAANAPVPAATGESGARYVLLAGSYQEPRSADEAKAKLALLGIVAKVQPITINGKTWNRVMVGPYSNASETEAVKKTLADNGVKAIPMKLAASQP